MQHRDTQSYEFIPIFFAVGEVQPTASSLACRKNVAQQGDATGAARTLAEDGAAARSQDALYYSAHLACSLICERH